MTDAAVEQLAREIYKMLDSHFSKYGVNHPSVEGEHIFCHDIAYYILTRQAERDAAWQATVDRVAVAGKIDRDGAAFNEALAVCRTYDFIDAHNAKVDEAALPPQAQAGERT